MAFDGITISSIVNELNDTINGGRLYKISQPEADEIMLTIKTQSGQYRLVLSANASLPLAYLTDDNKPSPATAPNFCMLLRKWMDEGIMPRPISVNVSRVNLYNPKFVEMLCTLTEKYRLPRNLLQLELTESAYTDNPQIIKEAMSRLHEKGFTVLMDDFGSGYSSLNIFAALWGPMVWELEGPLPIR